MSVRIRMKKLGRTHRPFFRICAMDARAPRDGQVIEELGYYDPMVPETDARAIFNRERVDYWVSVGAQPSEKVGVLIKKYGTNGSHVEAQAAALERLANRKSNIPAPFVYKPKPAPAPEPVAEAAPEASEPAETTEAAPVEAASE